MADYTQKAINFNFSMNDAEMSKGVDKLESQWNSMEKSVGKAEDGIDKVGKTIRQTASSGGKAIQKTGAAVAGAAVTTNKAVHKLGKTGTAVAAKVESIGDDASSSFDSATEAVAAYGRELDKVEDGLEKTGQAATVAGRGMALAFASAVESIRQTNMNLRDMAQQTGAVEAAESLHTNLLQVNRTLGWTKDQLAAFRREVTQIPQPLVGAIGVTEVGEAIEGLVNAGVRAREALQAYVPAVALMARATGTSVDQMAQDVYRYNSQFGLSIDQITRMQGTIHNLARENAVSFEDMRSSLSSFANEFEVAFRGMSTEARERVVTSFAAMRAAFAENWSDMAPVMEMAAKAMVDITSEEMQKMVAASGMAAQDIQQRLREGRIDEVMRAIMQRAGTYANQGTQALNAWAETTGISSAALSAMSRNQQSITGRLDRFTAGTYSAADGMSHFSGVVRNSTIWFDQLKTRISSLAARDIPGLGTSVADVVAEMSEINWIAMWAGYTVIKGLATSLWGLVGAMAGAGGAIGAIGTAIMGLGAKIGAVATLMLGPWGLIIAAIAAVVGGVIYLLHKTGQLGKVWDALKNAIMFALEPIIDTAKELWQTITDAFSSGAEGGMEWMKIGKALGSVFSFLFKIAGYALRVMFLRLALALKILKPVIKLLIGVGKLLWKVIGPSINWIATLFTEPRKAIEQLILGLNSMGLYLESIGTKIGEFLLDPLGGIQAAWEALFPFLQGLISGFVEWANAALVGFLEMLGLQNAEQVISGVWQQIYALVTAPIETMKKLINENIIGSLNSIITYELPLIGSLQSVTGVGTIPLLAEGAYIDEPTLAIIGEAGPEFVLPEDKLPEPTIQPIMTVNTGGDSPGGGTTSVVGVERRLDAVVALLRQQIQMGQRVSRSPRPDPLLNRILTFGGES